MRYTLPGIAAVTVIATVAATATPALGHTVGDNLPGGTSIEVSIDAPADAAVLPTGPVTITGTAAVGEGQPVADTAVVYVLDVSGSTTLLVDGGCGAGPSDDVLDCEIAAAQNLNAEAIASGTVGAVGAVVFATNGAAADVTPAGGDDLITGPATDAGGAAGPDIEQVLASAVNTPSGGITEFTARPSVGGGTNFAAAITTATTVATDPDNGMSRTIVAFMSDGMGGGDVPGALAGVPEDVDFFTFAVGAGSICGDEQTTTSLTYIALQTGGACEFVPDVSMLPDILPGVIASELTSLTLTVDGGGPIPITDITPTLPQAGPESVEYTATTDPLGPGTHELCVTAAGADAGGGGDVTDCHTITINAPPEVDAGGPYAGQEGSPVAIAGTVVDPDSPGVTTEWTIAPASGVDPGTTCTLDDASATSTTVECTDDGEFELTLTADDGVNPEVSDVVSLTLSNVAPAVEISTPDDGVLVEAGSTVSFEADFTDIGTNDTHTCTVDFDDGSPVADGTVAEDPGSGTCTASHSFSALGSHEVLVTVVDDDGAAATDVVTVVVYLPGEAFAIQANGLVTIPKTPHATCPPDESLTQAQLNAVVATVNALNASCTVDPATGETVASASIDSARLLGGAITISNIESTCVANADGVTRSSSVGTINGTPIGTGSGSITVPLVAQVFYNETTTGPNGQLVQNAIRVQTLLGQQIILAGCRLG